MRRKQHELDLRDITLNALGGLEDLIRKAQNRRLKPDEVLYATAYMAQISNTLRKPSIDRNQIFRRLWRFVTGV